jgi:VanZ family protein
VSLASKIPDEISHFFEFGILAFLFILGWSKGFRKNILKIHLYLTIIFSFLIALIDEFHQLFVVNRIFSIKDIFFDTLGILIFSLIIFKLKKP